MGTGSSTGEGVHRVRRAEVLSDRSGMELPRRCQSVPGRRGKVRFAERHQAPATVVADDVGPASQSAPLPEAEEAHEAQALRVAELRPVAELVLDHPTPQGDSAEDAGTLGSPEKIGLQRAMKAAGAIDVRGGVHTA